MMRIPPFGRPGVAYILRDSLYLSLTDSAPCTRLVTSRGPSFQMPPASGFCPLAGVEPTPDELVHIIHDCCASGDEDKIVTFAGLGDPLSRLDVLLETVRDVTEKRQGISFSVTTSGLYDSAVPAQLRCGGVHRVTVALNAADPATYAELMRPTNGRTFHDVCLFMAAAGKAGLHVTCATVETPGVDTTEVRKLGLSLGASTFKSRPFFP